MMGPIFSERDARLLMVCFVAGVVVGLPAIVGGLGYLAYRVVTAAWRGW
jgi:hypothetical protein